MKTYIIQLESHDDVISTRDKMGWSKAPRILLIWPRHGQVLERQVDLLVLQRRAAEMGAQLGVVSRREEVTANAQELGIPVFGSALQAQRSAWRRPRGRARRMNWRKWQRESVSGEELRRRRNELPSSREIPVWLRVVAFALGSFAVLTLIAFFYPSAEVRLTPALREQQLTLDVWASPQITVVNPSGGLPAGEVTVVVEGSDQILSTGLASLPGRTADGFVQFLNLTENPVDIPAEMVVSTLSSPAVRFATTRAVTVPAGAGSVIQAPVRALTPGSAGNVEAGAVQALEGSTGLSVVVTNPLPIEGGTDLRGPAPRASDFETLRESLLDQLQRDAAAEITRQLAAGEQLLAETVQVTRVLEEVREPEPGQPGDNARLRMRVEYSAWYFRSEDLEQVVLTALEVDNTARYSAVENSLKIEPLSQPVLDDRDTVRWSVQATRNLQEDWANTRIAQSLVGRGLPEAIGWMSSSLKLAEAPVIHVSPTWWRRMPFLAFRIEVNTP